MSRGETHARADREWAQAWPLDANAHKRLAASNTSDLDPLGLSTTTDSSCPESPTSFAQDLDANPEKHFLSPVHMYEYEDWADSGDSDSDSDAEDVAWDAAITDFALFDDDRRHAQQTGASLSTRWDGLMSSQASALQRSAERHALAVESEDGVFDDTPGLTPDTSPSLFDDLEDTAAAPRSRPVHARSASAVPRLTITPPPANDSSNEPVEMKPSPAFLARYYLDEDAPDHHPRDDGFLFPDWAPRRQDDRRLQRPGLRHARTLSGKAHVWRWPSVGLVREDVLGESVAEDEEMLF